jgi:predicted lipoprotein with Yx(FWY)xxD motif
VKTSSRGTLALAAIAALAVAGCGSSGKSSASKSGASGASAESTSATTSANAGGASGSEAGMTVTVVDAGGKLSHVLAAGSEKRTVYLFEADHGSNSSCSGACSAAWPPVVTQGAPKAGPGTVAADLGTITRSDGSKQLTYKGHPLYFFTGDSASGEAKGEGVTAFGAGWYVLAPSGKKIDLS